MSALDLAAKLACPPQSEISAANAGKSCTQNTALEKQQYQAVIMAQTNASDDEKRKAEADAQYALAQFARPLWRAIANPNAASCAFPAQAASQKDDKALAALIPLTVTLVNDANDASAKPLDDAKHTFNRTRPYACTADAPCNLGNLSGVTYLTPSDNPKPPAAKTSFPSGHATFAYMVAELLASIIPEGRDAIVARAAEYGHHRVVIGAHFDSDITGGADSASLIVKALMQTSFKTEIDAARVELRKQLCY
jgi:membrane-associated phospholipid phosphatase